MITQEQFHVGLAPFTDAYGAVRASYQQLNSSGQAIGTVDLCNGTVVRSASTWECDLGALMHVAKEHFYLNEP